MSTISACVPAGADFGSRTPDRTCQPSDASVRATSRPIPRLAPVISAVSFIYDSDLHDAPSPRGGGGQGWGRGACDVDRIGLFEYPLHFAFDRAMRPPP